MHTSRGGSFCVDPQGIGSGTGAAGRSRLDTLRVHVVTFCYQQDAVPAFGSSIWGQAVIDSRHDQRGGRLISDYGQGDQGATATKATTRAATATRVARTTRATKATTWGVTATKAARTPAKAATATRAVTRASNR